MTHYKEFVWLLCIVVVISLTAMFVEDAEARPFYQSAEASYYLLHGNRTACGKKASPQAFFVASLKKDTARCGLKVTICHRSRCVRTTVQDRGEWRMDNRRWDLQVRVKNSLRCPDTCQVKWHRGWTY